MSSQNRVDPFQIRLESGLGGRWPIRWRPGTSVEGGTRFWPSGFRVYPILAIAQKNIWYLYVIVLRFSKIYTWYGIYYRSSIVRHLSIGTSKYTYTGRTRELLRVQPPSPGSSVWFSLICSRGGGDDSGSSDP